MANLRDELSGVRISLEAARRVIAAMKKREVELVRAMINDVREEKTMSEQGEKFTGGEVVTFEHRTFRPDPSAAAPNSMLAASGWVALAGYIEVEPQYGRAAWIRELGTDRIIQAIDNDRENPAPAHVRNLRVVSRLGVEG